MFSNELKEKRNIFKNINRLKEISFRACFGKFERLVFLINFEL